MQCSSQHCPAVLSLVELFSEGQNLSCAVVHRTKRNGFDFSHRFQPLVFSVQASTVADYRPSTVRFQLKTLLPYILDLTPAIERNLLLRL